MLVCVYWDVVNVCAVCEIWVLYSAGSGVNRVQVVLSGLSVRLLGFTRQIFYVGMVLCIY